ncbi:hypothetical protein O181_027964 [Austropuccinia psidii MF-1]|uniref:RNase III domain-containing protein n=1 Tax=Austropuccinia psidii MF-1 TaxID=1389203 RepID=A0A9Q3CMZ6_9BASI|nr:hypothetical protein [Austropuccinia psidii MF-1]
MSCRRRNRPISGLLAMSSHARSLQSTSTTEDDLLRTNKAIQTRRKPNKTLIHTTKPCDCIKSLVWRDLACNMPNKPIPFLQFRSGSEEQLIFRQTNSQTINVDQSNSLIVLNQLEPFLYPPTSRPQFSYETITKPNCNPIFRATLRLPPIDPHLPADSTAFTTSQAVSTKNEAKQQAALLACQTLCRLNLPLSLFNLPQSIGQPHLIENQDQRPARLPSDSNQLIFQLPNGSSINVNQSNSVAVFNQLETLLYPQNLNQPSPRPTYSFQTINKPNCNPSFIATLSLPPIDSVLPIGFNSFTTSAAFSSKREAKQQVAFLACQALSELHLPPTLYNLTITVPPQDLIESQEQQPSPSDSNSLLIFRLSNGTSINVDQSNSISVLNHLEPLLYSQNRDRYRTGQPLLQSEYSFHTVTTPNQNPSFVATISLPPIDSLPSNGPSLFTTSEAFCSKRKAKQQVALLACQALSQLNLSIPLYNHTKTIPSQNPIEMQNQQSTKIPSDSNQQLLFQPPKGSPVNVDLSNSIAVLNHLYLALKQQSQTDQPSLQLEYKYQTLTKPNQNPTFTATLSLPPISPQLPIDSNFFTTSEAHSSKRQAKQQVALLACQALSRLNLPIPLYNLATSIEQPHPIENQEQLSTRLTSALQISPSNPNNSLPSNTLPNFSSSPITQASSPTLSLPEISNLPDLPDFVQFDSPNIFGHPNHSNQFFLHKINFQLPSPQPQLYSIGLITSHQLNPQTISSDRPFNTQRLSYTIEHGSPLNWSNDERKEYLGQLDHFTKLVIQISVCRRDFQGELLYFLAPLTSNGLVDYDLIKQPLLPVTQPTTQLHPLPTSQLIVVPLRRLHFRLFKFSHFSLDLRLESQLSTTNYHSSPLSRFFKHASKFKSLGHFFSVIQQIPKEQQAFSTLVYLDAVFKVEDEVIQVLKSDSNQEGDDDKPYQAILPHRVLKISQLSLEFWRVVAYLPFLIRDIIHAEYSRRVSEYFKCTNLSLNLITQALTPPGRQVFPDYQTLETIGDSFLKLATTVHLYLSQPTMTEGVLSPLRSKVTDNVYLRRKLFDSGIAAYILSSMFRTGDHFLPTDVEDGLFSVDVGAYLHLCFGGSEAWANRTAPGKLIKVDDGTAMPSTDLDHLEEKIGYVFQNPRFLVRALTHRTMTEKYEDCYERQEWLGDAVLDLWIIDRLYRRFSPLTSAELTTMRASLVSNGTLGFLALRKLSLESLILHRLDGFVPNQVQDAMKDFSPFDTLASFFANLTNVFVVPDPPKVLGDVVEAIIGGVFIDSGLTIEPAFKVLDRIYEDALGQLSKCEPRDPMTRLQLLRNSSGCKQIVSHWGELKIANHVESEIEEGSPKLANLGEETEQECWISFHGHRVGASVCQRSRLITEQRASLEALKKIETLIEKQKEVVIDDEVGWKGCDCSRVK